MKTSKFYYGVIIYDDETDTTKKVDCVTLAEARLIASRCSRAQIICLGEINYENGLEEL